MHFPGPQSDVFKPLNLLNQQTQNQKTHFGGVTHLMTEITEKTLTTTKRLKQ